MFKIKILKHNDSFKSFVFSKKLHTNLSLNQQFKTKLSSEEINTIHSKNLNPVLKTLYHQPLIIKNGQMQFVYDNNNKKYLDFFGGIVTTSVGHCHPYLVEKLKLQASKLWHVSSLYNAEETHEFAMKLVSKFPSHLNNVFFCNSGSEANELAVMIARLHTQANEIISLQNCYHGCSPTTLGLNGIGEWKHKLLSSFGIHHVTNPDVYRGKYGNIGCRDSMSESNTTCKHTDHNQCCSNYVKDFESLLNDMIAKNNFAAFIVESIQGVGGTVQYPRNYLKEVSEIVKKNNGLLISDEVQTGFGRTGKNFWGFQNHGIKPDIVTMAKGIGNGFPLAAVITSKEIASSLDKAKFFNTYGGNPLAMTVGSAVLDIIENEKLQQNSFNQGKVLLDGLNKFKDKYEVVGDVRGLGLMIGVELVENKESKVHLAPAKVNKLLDDCKTKGLLVGKGGPKNSVLRIKPPMCITKEDVDFCLEILDDCLAKINN